MRHSIIEGILRRALTEYQFLKRLVSVVSIFFRTNIENELILYLAHTYIPIEFSIYLQNNFTSYPYEYIYYNVNCQLESAIKISC